MLTRLLTALLLVLVVGGVGGCTLPDSWGPDSWGPESWGPESSGTEETEVDPGPSADPGTEEDPATEEDPGGTRPPDSGAVRRATRRLAGFAPTSRPRGTDGYQRTAFGSAWRDIDDNGCNQRDDVLLRDAVPGTVRVGTQGRCAHDVLAGTFVDPYAGRRHVLDDLKNPSQAQAVQIDHVVPLAEAWVSGAAQWSPERRARYANDTRGLLAVDGATNASKGAQDPASWRPRKAYQCAYAVRWIAVKHRWELSVDVAEVAALREMLAFC